VCHPYGKEEKGREEDEEEGNEEESHQEEEGVRSSLRKISP
jgi:hypothetical protein